MQIQYKSVDYYEEKPQAELIFGLSDNEIGPVDICAFINEHAGQFGLGLFSGVGGDHTLLQELKMQGNAELIEAVLSIAKNQNVDTNDERSVEEFLLEIEDQASRLVPDQVWSKLRRSLDAYQSAN